MDRRDAQGTGESDRPPPLAPEPSEPHFVRSERRGTPHGIKRAAKIVGAIVGTGVVFVVSVAGGAVLHVGLPPARRLAVGGVNATLAGSFRGKIELVRIDHLGMDGLDGAATIAAPDGKRVLLVDGVRARASVPSIVRSLLGSGPMRIDLSDLSIDYVDALLEQTRDGSLTIAEAFQPAKEVPPTSAKSKGVELSLRRIALAHAWVHGRMNALPIVDADLDELAASFGMNADRTSADVRRLRLATRGLPDGADIGALLEAHLVLPAVDVASGLDGSIAFVGTVGGIDLGVHGAIAGKRVDASIDAPSVTPAQLARMLGQSPILEVATAHAEAHGTLPEIDPVAHLTLGAGTLDLHGHVTVPSEGQPATRAHVVVAARQLDVRSVSAAGPASRLGVDTTIDGRILGDAIDGTYDVHVLPGVIAAQLVPDARIAGRFTKSEIRGTARIAEPGAPTTIAFAVQPQVKGGPRIEFDSQSDATDLSRIPRLGASMKGRVLVHAAGNVALGDKQVDARVETTLDRFAMSGVAIDHAAMTGAVNGSLGAPTASVDVAGHGLSAGSLVFPVFAASAHGSQGELLVSAKLEGNDAPTVTASATLGAQGGTSARDVVVTIDRGKDTVTARVASFASKGGVVDVEGLRVEGAGQPLTGEAHLKPGSLAVKVLAPDLDVPKLLRVAGSRAKVQSGTVALDVDLTASKRATHGHANIELRDVSIEKVIRGAQAKLQTTFDGRRLEGRLDARDQVSGELHLTTKNLELAGGAMDPRAWRDATGSAHTEARVDLGRLDKELPADLPLEEVGGWLTAAVDVTRASTARRPQVSFDVATRGLVFTTTPKTAPNGDGTVTIVGKPIHSEGMDGRVRASLDGESGLASVDAIVADKHGALVTMNAKSTLPMKELLAGGARDALLATPVKGQLAVPLRSLDALPPVLGKFPVHGDVGFAIDVDGSAKAPRFVAVARARNIADADDSTPIPVTFDTAISYDGANARAQLVAVRPEGKVIDASANVAVRAADLMTAQRPIPWEANADVKLSDFPVGCVTDFAGQDIDGDLSGTIALHDLHKAGRLEANLDMDKIEVDGTKFAHASATLAVRDGTLAATTRVEQVDGYADVRVNGGMTWGTEVAPTVDATKPVDVALRAQNFRAAAIAPFVQGAVNELDGLINADARLHAEPGLKDGKMTGVINVDKGVFESPAIGEEFHNLRARIFMNPWGVWNVQELSADGVSGHFTANAVAKVDGLHLRAAEAHVVIRTRQKLPLSMQGVSMGTAWGRIDTTAKVSPDGSKIDVDVNVPQFHFELPQSSTHAVQTLDQDPTLKVGVHLKDGTMAVLPLDPDQAAAIAKAQKPAETKTKGGAPPTTLHVVTHLGKDIEVKRGTMLKAYVTGGPTIDVGTETKVSGGITIPRGYIEVQGKRFNIEKGTVNFTGQPPDDPIVLATAAYEAPDGTKVFADFVGPVKTGKLTLRSEPQLSQNEILSLLLFGQADGTFGSSGSGQDESGAAKAAGLAGGVMTEGLNKAISGITSVEVTTKVDTSESDNPRPEIEVGLTRTVSATVTHNLGVPPPGQNPDDTLLSVDWRFHKGWSTEATLGDKGTSILDLAWKYRY